MNKETQTGSTLLEQLKQLCRDIDDGNPLRRINLGRALGPAVVGVSLALGGCPADLVAPLYAAPGILLEICDDGVDNDTDGHIDCADPDCFADALCAAAPEYAAPMPDRPTPDSSISDPGETTLMYGSPLPE